MVTLDKLFKIKPHPSNNRYRSIEFRWNNIEKIPEFAILELCEQNPKWHSEGNAMIHTKLVCKYAVQWVKNYASVKDTEYGIHNIARNFDDYETGFLDVECFDIALTLLLSALFHDIGKGVTTVKGKDGNWHSYDHENKGEKITRKLLWDFPLKRREDVCSLVKYHMLPLHLYERKNYIEEIIRISYNIPSWELLLALKQCDLEGSIQKDEILKTRDKKILDEIISITKEIRRYSSIPKLIPSVFYDRIKGSQYYLDKYYKKPLELIFLIGIPGAGKDTFINEQLLMANKEEKDYICLRDISNCPKPSPTLYRVKKDNVYIVCRDEMRVKLGFCKENEKVVCSKKDEEEVSKAIKEELAEAASEGKTIIVNNTNLKKQYREEISRFLSNYNLHITYVYIEASEFEKNVERRDGQMTRQELEACTMSLEWPEFNEYDDFFLVQN